MFIFVPSGIFGHSCRTGHKAHLNLLITFGVGASGSSITKAVRALNTQNLKMGRYGEFALPSAASADYQMIFPGVVIPISISLFYYLRLYFLFSQAIIQPSTRHDRLFSVTRNS